MSHNKNKKLINGHYRSKPTVLLYNVLAVASGIIFVLFTIYLLATAYRKDQAEIELVEPFIEYVEVDEVQAVEPKYLPPKHVVEAMNHHPGLMTDIKNVFGDDWTIAAEIIYRESSFNPKAINPSSGACGLVQALPCEKLTCELEDTDCQLKWMKDYIDERYETLKTAKWHHDYYGWY